LGMVELTSNSNNYAGTTIIGGGGGLSLAPAANDRIILSVGNGGATGKLGGGDVTINSLGTLKFNRVDTYTVPNNISGTGNVTADAVGGVVSLTGPNTYGGTTAVNAGTLLVNNSHNGGSDYTVASGATLGGSGSIGGSVVNVQTGGHLAPGSSLGTFTLGGNVNMTGGIFDWQLGALKDQATGTGGTDFDLAFVGGDLAVDNTSSVALDFSLLTNALRPGNGNAFWSASHSWKIIDASTNSTSGNFGSVTTTAPGTWGLTLGTGADLGDIFLTYAAAALLNGDVNGDHVVNQLDLNVVFGNWLSTGATLAQGDANHDGVINQLDINTITGNWLATGPAAGLSSNVVPEPGSIALLGFGLLGFARYRRRHKQNQG
jgi:autotransporter-associated beta strand protein